MGLQICKICCCFVGTNKGRNFPVVLIGLTDSGKTEIGRALANIKRNGSSNSTNGAQQYQVNLTLGNMILTEIGGSEDLQNLWPYYFAVNMGIIFCFDMSTPFDIMAKSFDLLKQIAVHPYVSGKPILLVGTKSDLTSSNVQIYDIENIFNLESLANCSSCYLHSCFYGKNDDRNLKESSIWLMKILIANNRKLKNRINYDMMNEETIKSSIEPNIKGCKEERSKKFCRKYRRIRPATAPSILIIKDVHSKDDRLESEIENETKWTKKKKKSGQKEKIQI